MRLALAAALALAAGPAAALSCASMTAADIYRSYDARPETFIAAYGRFTDLMLLGRDDTTHISTWRATFVGHRASGRAFDRPFTAEVAITYPLLVALGEGTADPLYLKEWLPRETGIVYIQREGEAFRARVDVCLPFVDTDPANVRPTLDCIAGRRCEGSD